MANSDRYHLDIGSGVQIPMSNTDMAFNIGSLIGGLWAKNYNERGAQKSTAEAEAALKGGQQNGVPDDLYNQYRSMQDANAQYGLPQGQSPQGWGTDTNWQNANSQFGLPGGQQQQIGFGTQQGIPNTVTIGGQQVNPTLRQGITSGINDVQKRDLAAEKLDYLVDKYSKGTPNPDGDATVVRNTTDVLNRNIGGIDFSKLPSYSVEDVSNALRAQLAKSGRNEWQIEQALKNVSPLIRAKVQQGNDTKIANMRQTLDDLISQGRTDDANVLYQRMAQIDPIVARGLAPKMERALASSKSEANFRQQFDFLKRHNPGWSDQDISNYIMFKSTNDPKTTAQMAAAQQQWNNNYRMYQLANRGTGRSGSSRTATTKNGTPYNAQAVKDARTRITEIEEAISDSGGDAKKFFDENPRLRQEYNAKKDYVDGYDQSTYGYKYGDNVQPQEAITNWTTQVEPMIKDALKAGKTPAEIVKNARALEANKLLPEGWAQKIENSFDYWKSDKASAPAQPKEKSWYENEDRDTVLKAINRWQSGDRGKNGYTLFNLANN